MKDIAKDLDLSVVTISKVLRNHPDIAEQTRERVMRRVKELEYQPNLMARSLVTGRSYLVGLIVPDLLHPFFAEVAKALSATLRSSGYSVIISSSEENAEMEAQEIEQLIGRRLDALVVASAGTATTSFDRMDRNGVPYILIDRQIPGITANYVGVDDEAMGRIATAHLIDQGCERVAHIGGTGHSAGVSRLKGYRDALRRRRIPYRDDLVVGRPTVDTNSVREGAEAARILISRKDRPQGIFVFNDPLAIGAMNAIWEAGLRIPEDIAVVGCGNLHYDELLRVPLSSIDQHSTLIGERVGKIALSMIESKVRPETTSVILEPTLMVRASSLRRPVENSPAAALNGSARRAPHKGRS